MSDTGAWVATEDPTEGDLPATEFMGSKKDLEQTLPPEEGDGSEIEPEPGPRDQTAKTEQEAGE